MKDRNFLISLVVVLVIFGLLYSFFRRSPKEVPSPPAETLPFSQEEETGLESQVGIEIPEDIEKTKLEDVKGGEAMGIATRKFEEDEFEHTVTASLPDPEPGKFYQGWLGKDGELVPSARLVKKKGGWVLSFTDQEDKTDFNRVVITLEEKDDDLPEERVLEGEFQGLGT